MLPGFWFFRTTPGSSFLLVLLWAVLETSRRRALLQKRTIVLLEENNTWSFERHKHLVVLLLLEQHLVACWTEEKYTLSSFLFVLETNPSLSGSSETNHWNKKTKPGETKPGVLFFLFLKQTILETNKQNFCVSSLKQNLVSC